MATATATATGSGNESSPRDRGGENGACSLIECRICNERYTATDGDHAPRRFPCCGNVICHRCAGSLIDNSTASRVNCAYCRSVCDARQPDELQLCRVTLNLVDSLCAECRENINTSPCPHCTSRYCMHCLPRHSEVIRTDIQSFFTGSVESLRELQAEEERLHELADSVREMIADIEKRGAERISEKKAEIDEKVQELRDAVEAVQGGIEAASPRSLPRIPSLDPSALQTGHEEAALLNSMMRLCNRDSQLSHEDIVSGSAAITSRVRQAKPEIIDLLQVASSRLPGDARFMAALPDGRLAISCLNQHKVIFYRLEGTRLNQDSELVHDALEGPEGVAACDDYLVVACGSNTFRGILCFDYPSLELRNRHGGPQGNDRFSLPLGVAIDKTRELVYVTDCLDERVQILSLPDLQPVDQFGASSLSQPWDVDTDADLVFVTHDHGVAVFDASNGYRLRSNFDCGLRPHGCHVDKRYESSIILVCDRWGKMMRAIDEDGNERGVERLCGGERPYSVVELNGSILVTARGDDNNWRCITLWTTT